MTSRATETGTMSSSPHSLTRRDMASMRGTSFSWRLRGQGSLIHVPSLWKLVQMNWCAGGEGS